MGHPKVEPKWPWRDFLTEEEAEIVALADQAKELWRKLNGERRRIENNAIHRAKYAAQKK